MKRCFFKNLLVMVGFTLTVSTIFSCKYEKIETASYPDQKLYMSTAANASPTFGGNGIYNVNAVAVPGQVFRYEVDLPKRRFNILLGVVRAGINLDGNVAVNISASTDTVTKLIAKGVVLNSTTRLLPGTAYNLGSAITLPGGSASMTFPLSVDLDFLLNNPNQKYGLAVGISSQQRAVNPALATTVILIDTQFLIPTANFTSAADPTNVKKINFTNTATNGVSYLWDFGDGTPTSSDKSTSHVYAAAGPYTVRLTVVGATGDAQKATITRAITVL